MTGRLQLRNGKYTMVLSYQTACGKRKQKWIATGLEEKNNKRNAETMLRKALEDYAYLEELSKEAIESLSPTKAKPEKYTMEELFNEWLALKEVTVRRNSYAIYKVTLESHVLPFFKRLGLNVVDVKPSHIQQYINGKVKNGIAPATIIKHNTILHGAFEYAIRTLEILEANPCSRVTLPKKTKRIPKFYTDEQIKELFTLVEGHILETPVKLSATYGLRRSEVLGLRWSSVDFEDKTMTIDHTAVQCKTEILYDDTAKSASSLRSFPLTPSMEEYLRRIKSQQEAESSRYGPAYTHSDYVCRREDGTLIKPAYVTQVFPKFLVDNNMPRIRFHDLRHSSASLLINAGFTLKEVQEWLGHSDINSTNIYSHLLYKSKENMADKVEKMLGL